MAAREREIVPVGAEVLGTAQNIAAFMDRLEAIGRVSMETRPLAIPDGNVTVEHENRP